MKSWIVGLVVLFLTTAAFGSECCCCNKLLAVDVNTPTVTATPTVTPPLPPETPGNVVDCIFVDTQATTQSGDGFSWDLSLALEPYPVVFLDYDNTSGSTAILKLSSLNFTFPTVDTTIHGIEVVEPAAALPNGVTPPFAPSSDPCNSWTSEPRNTYAQLSNESGAPVGDDKSTGYNITTSPNQLFGDAESDLWGTTWTPAQLNDPDFGIFLTFDFTTGPSENEPPCDLYHIFVNNNPDYFPQIQGGDAHFRICYEHPPNITPMATQTATETPTPTATGTVTNTPTVGVNETKYHMTSYDQIANGGTLTWTSSNPTTLWNSVTTSTNLLRIHLAIKASPPNNTAPGAGATIVGIAVTGSWLINTVNSTNEVTFQLLNSSDTLVGTNKGTATTIVTGTTTRGASNDTWSTGWVGADISGSWGYAIQVSGSDSGPPGSIVWNPGPVVADSVSVFWTP